MKKKRNSIEQGDQISGKIRTWRAMIVFTIELNALDSTNT